MAVAIDATSSPHTASNVTTLSWTHTPVGTPTAVAVTTYGFATNTSDTATCTYGGVTMTPVTHSFDSTPDIGYIFGLANPPAGPQTVVITYSAANYPIATSISVTGSDTTTCFSNVATPVTGTTSAGVDISIACTSSTGELVLSAAGVDATTMNGSGTQTDYMNGATNGGEAACASTQAGGGSVTATYSVGAGAGFVLLAASFKVASANVNLFAQACM